jgi:hypothetical protein
MTTKMDMVERLGETAVLLPSLIGDALTANDRIKLRLSLLQEAASHAQAPSREPRSFRAECQEACLADDVAGFAASAGILIAIGGRTAHAAVVARQLGKVCLVGCRDFTIEGWRRGGDGLLRGGADT